MSDYKPEAIRAERAGTLRVQAQINALRLIRQLQAALEENELINSSDIDQINNVYYTMLGGLPMYAQEDLRYG